MQMKLNPTVATEETSDGTLLQDESTVRCQKHKTSSSAMAERLCEVSDCKRVDQFEAKRLRFVPISMDH